MLTYQGPGQGEVLVLGLEGTLGELGRLGFELYLLNQVTG